MAPEGAKPFDMALHHRITGEIPQCAGDVLPAHLPHSPEQIAGVVEHDPWVATLLQQLGDEVGQAPVALGKRLGVVVVALALVFNHVLKVGDQAPIRTGRDRGLMHVQRTGKTGTDLIQPQIGARQPHRRLLLLLHQLLQLDFPASDRWDGEHGRTLR